jgi:ketosteroid isomerase-like protein
MHETDVTMMAAVLVGTADPEIVGLEARVRAAQLQADVAALDALLAETLLFTGRTARSERSSRISRRTGRAAVRFREHVSEELRVRRVGPDAVAALRARLAVSVGGTLVRGTYRYTRVWAREDGGSWRVVSGHVSAIPGGDGATS